MSIVSQTSCLERVCNLNRKQIRCRNMCLSVCRQEKPVVRDYPASSWGLQSVRRSASDADPLQTTKKVDEQQYESSQPCRAHLIC